MNPAIIQHTATMLTVIMFLIVPAFSLLWLYIAARVVCNGWLAEKRRVYLKNSNSSAKVIKRQTSHTNTREKNHYIKGQDFFGEKEKEV